MEKETREGIPGEKEISGERRVIWKEKKHLKREKGYLKREEDGHQKIEETYGER